MSPCPPNAARRRQRRRRAEGVAAPKEMYERALFIFSGIVLYPAFKVSVRHCTFSAVLFFAFPLGRPLFCLVTEKLQKREARLGRARWALQRRTRRQLVCRRERSCSLRNVRTGIVKCTDGHCAFSATLFCILLLGCPLFLLVQEKLQKNTPKGAKADSPCGACPYFPPLETPFIYEGSALQHSSAPEPRGPMHPAAQPQKIYICLGTAQPKAFPLRGSREKHNSKPSPLRGRWSSEARPNEVDRPGFALCHCFVPCPTRHLISHLR